MAENIEYDWAEVTGKTVEKLRTKKAPAVPDSIVALAQASYDENHAVKAHRFPSEAVAAKFAKHMKNAGHFTKPESTVAAVVDPFNKGEKRLVHWQAKTKRAPRTQKPAEQSAAA